MSKMLDLNALGGFPKSHLGLFLILVAWPVSDTTLLLPTCERSCKAQQSHRKEIFLLIEAS